MMCTYLVEALLSALVHLKHRQKRQRQTGLRTMWAKHDGEQYMEDGGVTGLKMAIVRQRFMVVSFLGWYM